MDQTTVLEALKTVQDPSCSAASSTSAWSRDIVVDDDHIAVRVVLTTAACPLRNRIQSETEAGPGADRRRSFASK